MTHDFQRIAIINRGEAAMRFIHAVREFNYERGESLRTIAVFTDPDRRAMFVRESDDSVYLGPPHSIDVNTGLQKSSYVDYGRLQIALNAAAADAVWVGWGFVAEHAEFADLCRELGIIFIGPSGDVMRRLGDKIASKLLAEQAQIPVAPWSRGPVESLADAREHADRLGYPLLIKATAGGGGHGIRRVQKADQLPELFESARNEAFKAFGNPTVFMEQLLEDARHVEVQVIADHFGTTWAAGVRDCTTQRRHQKVLEEAPSPALTIEQDESLREAAVRLSKAAGYHNAGTVEFLYQPKSQQFAFMEMNTRLQVEHPVTECTTGLDLVKLQIHVARGGRLEGDAPRTVGHAIEVRLNAEDPDNAFAPAPGAIERFRILSGPGVRIDTGVAEGDSVPPEFDSMIAKIIGFGRNRGEALSRLQRALQESVVVIRRGASNKAFLLNLLNRPELRRAEVDIGWLDRISSNGQHLSRQYADVALLGASIEAYDAGLAIEQAQFFASAVRGRPQLRSELGRRINLRYGGCSYDLKVFRLGPRQYRVDLKDSHTEIDIDRLGEFEYWLTAFGRRFHIVSVSHGLDYRIEVEGVSHRVQRDDGGMVHSPAPAVVVSIAVKPGDVVSAGDRLAVLEAMKMEMPVVAPFPGTVRKVFAIPNVQVDTGTPLVQIDPREDAEVIGPTERIVIGASADGRLASASPAGLEEVRQLMLGFDVEPAKAAQALVNWNRDCPISTEDARRAEDDVLNIFVDICSLFQRQPEVDEAFGGEVPTTETYLFSYLRSIETRGDNMPLKFVEALKRAVAHYGISELDPSPELQQSLLWIYKSHQRIEQQIAAILMLLERKLEQISTGLARPDDSSSTLLDRMSSITRGLYPKISDLAQELRYQYIDKPMFECTRRRVYSNMEAHLAYIAANPDAVDRRERMCELVECPQPLMGFLARRFATAQPWLRRFMLEVLTSRYYRIRALMNLHSFKLDGQCYASAEYDFEGKRIHVFATHALYSSLEEATKALFPMVQEVPGDEDIVLDIYLSNDSSTSDAKAMQQTIQGIVNAIGFPQIIRRLFIAVAGTISPGENGGVQYFTYRPSDNGYKEDKIYRGIHPMMAKRLHLWRLNNFHIERLPSAEDVYFLRATARDNPKDERLIACVEVRDLTPVRDETGKLVQLPHLERMFAESLAAIRVFQSKRKTNERLHWNRILLYVWPPLTIQGDELNRIVSKLLLQTDSLGLEQVVIRGRIPNPQTGELRDMVIRISNPAGRGLLVTFRPATNLQPIKPLTEYDQKVVRMRQRGMTYPYEIIRMLTPDLNDTSAEFPPGEFIEHDLDADGEKLIPVARPYGQNKSNIIVGIIRNFTRKYPEGLARVLLLGDPSRDLGALAEAECRRISAAVDLAEQMKVPVEWFPISAGAKISMESGVENMDWIARVLRRLVTFTQGGGEVNLLINGINVGAQPYWNAEATMLMHTRGILVMTPNAAMVLTGKRALDFSGGVSAEDNQGIGGYDRIMGLNGQAQYWARDIDEACHILFRHYDHTYIMPGERFPRRATTNDPSGRDVRLWPYGAAAPNEESFRTIGEILCSETNPGHKKAFDVRKVMMAVVDHDHTPLERWAGMRAAETAVVWDAHLGGYPVCLIGIESRPVPRIGFVPADGPENWCAGTLFPQSSKKVARAINAATNNRPVVVLANLSGFDGSPESLRKLQLEYGAEIGRAVVNFKGPMIFCVISRYHGGAYVVFSRTLNEQLEVIALEGTYASVIGGAPAAAVVFAGEVAARARKDPRMLSLNEKIGGAEGATKSRLHAECEELFKIVHSEKLGEVADQFDHVHSVQRALRVGALNSIIPPMTLRPYLIDAIGRAQAAGQEYRSAEGEVRETAAA